MDYPHMDFITHVRDGVVDVCRDHFHDAATQVKQSADGLYRLGVKLNEKVSIRSRRLLNNRPTEDDIVNQARILCRDYMYVKLRKHKLLSKDGYDHRFKQRNIRQLNFMQLKDENNETCRSGTPKRRGYGSETTPADVSQELIKVANEFEKCFPYLYEDLAEQLQLNFQTPSNVQQVFNVVAANIFRKGITWARIIALFTLTGALVVECVNQGHQAQANLVVDSLQRFVRKRLAVWIIDQGGWVGLVVHFRQKQSSGTVLRVLSLGGILLGLLLTFWIQR